MDQGTKTSETVGIRLIGDWCLESTPYRVDNLNLKLSVLESVSLGRGRNGKGEVSLCSITLKLEGLGMRDETWEAEELWEGCVWQWAPGKGAQQERPWGEMRRENGTLLWRAEQARGWRASTDPRMDGIEYNSAALGPKPSRGKP
jgi:hypothetical protein